MIKDALQYTGQDPIRSDICIVGGGPAGIVLAIELARSGKHVTVLESGGTKFNASLNDLNRGEVTDFHTHGPLEDYRRRCLGGATTSWGGRCVPFDGVDFDSRSFVPNSGWPIGKSDLDPYYARAHTYLELGEYTYNAREALLPGSCERKMIPDFTSPELTMESIYRFSMPTNFGQRWRRDLISSPRINVFLNANCLEISTNREGTCVERMIVGTTNGKRLQFLAHYYILAAGGLEVTRLLLASNRVHLNGIGNQNDLLGRYYMCHLTHHFEVEFHSSGVIWDYEKSREGVYCQRTVSVPAEKQLRLELLNHRARIEHPPIADPCHNNGVLSAAYLSKWILRNKKISKYLSPRMGTFSRGVIDLESPEKRDWARRNLLAHSRNVLTDFPAVLRLTKRWLKERVFSERKLPSLVLGNEADIYTFRIDAEQVPNPESRVTLNENLDAFGQRRIKVNWRYTETDTRSLARTAEEIGRVLTASGAGTARSIPAVDAKATGGHHCGTTRMASSASQGVVDANCRVHGVGNLFIASSSVFPTSSYANPTLTIVGLAIRLADYLVRER